MSDKRPKCPNYPKYPCGDCPACQVPESSTIQRKCSGWRPSRSEDMGGVCLATQQVPTPAAAPKPASQPPVTPSTQGQPAGLYSWPPESEAQWFSGFREAWPAREAIAAHQGGAGRRLVTDPYGVKTLGAFDGNTFHVLMRWHVAGELTTAPGQPWKFEPYAPDQAAPAPPASTDSPGQPQAPAPPEGPATAPGAHQVDAAGFRSWPSEEEIEVHEARGGIWLAKENGRLSFLGSFTLYESLSPLFSTEDGHTSRRRDTAPNWTFCPIDDNGDKLDAAPVLRGEDARRLVEQLGRVAPPEEIARRRADARRRLAENEAAAERLVEKMTASQARVAGIGGLQSEADRALNLRPLTKDDRCPRCDEYVVPCPKCPPSSLPKASPLVTESLGSGMEVPGFKDEHAQMDLDARELAAVKAELASTKQRLIDVTNKLNETNLRRVRDLKSAVEGLAKYAVPVGPAGFENDRIGRLTEPAVARILSTLPARSPDRRVLVVLRGLPGSGKSTVAQAIVDSDPGRWARVSKDDVRQMMVGPSGDLFRHVEDLQREAIVGRTIRAAVSESLAAGLDVVIDATNLTEKALEAWVAEAARFAVFHKRTVAIAERAVPTPVEECVARDARRGARSVGRAVIERLAATIDVPLEDRNQEVGQ